MVKKAQIGGGIAQGAGGKQAGRFERKPVRGWHCRKKGGAPRGLGDCMSKPPFRTPTKILLVSTKNSGRTLEKKKANDFHSTKNRKKNHQKY